MNSCAACGVTPMSFASVNARLSVEQRVVDHLRGAAQLVRVAAAVRRRRSSARSARGCRRPARNASMSTASSGQVREHAELDLRVVGRDQHVARFGDERAADLAAELGPDRDVLQVRIAAAQASGRGDRLVEAGVHAAGLRVARAAAARRCRCPSASCSPRHSRISRGSSWASASSSSTSTAVDGARDVPVRFSTGSCSLSNRISASCFGELMLNSPPATSKICVGRARQLLLDAAATAPRARGRRCGRRRARWRPAPESAAARASRRPPSSCSFASSSRNTGASWPTRSARSPA